MKFPMLAGAAAFAAPLIVAVASAASPTAQVEPADASRQAQAIITDYDAERLSTDPAYATELGARLDALRPRVRDEKILFALDFVRQNALLMEGKNEESYRVGADLVAKQPDLAVLYPTVLWAAYYAEKTTETLALLESAAKHVSDPADRAMLIAAMDRELVFSLLLSLDEADDKAPRHRAAEVLLALGWPADGRTGGLDAIRAIAMEGRRDRGDIAGARALARLIEEPRQLLKLMIDKRYDGLFDDGTDRVKRLESALAAYEEHSADHLRSNPGDLDALLDRAQHLRSRGREEEALALLLPTTSDMAAVAATGEKAFWIVNEAAYALNATGKNDRAVAIMAEMLKLPLKEHPTLISMAINHGAVLNEAGRHREAAQWEAALETRAKDFANDYGFMWINAEAACGHSLAGDPAGAAPWMAKLAAGSDKNPAAYMRGLLCANDLDAAEKLLLARLSGKDRETVLMALQDYSIDTAASARFKIIQNRWAALRARPAVQAAIARIGRVLTVPLSRIYWGEY